MAPERKWILTVEDVNEDVDDADGDDDVDENALDDDGNLPLSLKISP